MYDIYNYFHSTTVLYSFHVNFRRVIFFLCIILKLRPFKFLPAYRRTPDRCKFRPSSLLWANEITVLIQTIIREPGRKKVEKVEVSIAPAYDDGAPESWKKLKWPRLKYTYKCIFIKVIQPAWLNMKVRQCSDGRMGKPGKPAGLPKINWEAPKNYDITLWRSYYLIFNLWVKFWEKQQQQKKQDWKASQSPRLSKWFF